MKGDDEIGDRFQELTKYAPTRLGGGARPARRPAGFKEYASAEALPIGLAELPAGSLWKALQDRRSRRSFTDQAISREALSQLVWAVQGPTGKAGDLVLRTAPSAGALYPLETYLVVNRVDGLKEGLYHYNVRKTALELIKKGAQGPALTAAAFEQGMCARAAVVFALTAIADRCKWKYAQRAWRYVYMEAGHLGQSLYLAAADLGLGCCAVGAFYDENINDILGVDGESETILYLLPVGPVKEKPEEE